MNLLKKAGLLLAVFACSLSVQAQEVKKEKEKTISAGPQYKRSAFYQLFWGSNYRKEWTTPVNLPVIYLDTLRGGLISLKEGGSNQSKSLQLKTKNGEYALRSVDKTLEKVIPDIFENTFITDIVNDAISMSNPYGALAVPGLAGAAGINHTIPQYFYLPAQATIDSFDYKYAGKVYLLEERPKDDWSHSDNLGNFKDFDDLEDFMKKILKDQDNIVDQHEFARARMIDMLIGDFDRHGDQWKWGVKKEGEKTHLIPVPTDRDQAFSTKSGLLLGLVIRVAGLKFIQKYDHDIDNVKALAQINRLLDRLVTNKMTLTEWKTIAEDVKLRLTDDVIVASVKNMPPEIFSIRGEKLISKLKSRRNDLTEYVTDYYKLLAEEAEVVGTEKDDYFEINNLQNNSTEVKVFKINKRGTKEATPYYSRTFIESETDEVRIYGIGGNDILLITGKLNKEINLRFIGGNEKDSIIDQSVSNGKGKIHVYDNSDNKYVRTPGVKLHISNDSAVHVYDYNTFKADKKGIVPHLIYNDEDRIFLGLRYHVLNYRWRKKPFSYKQSLDVDYSVTQKAFSTTYNGLFPNLFGKWDFVAKANYDEVRWINFYGLGNETPNITDDRDYYRMRTEEGIAAIGLNRKIDKHLFRVTGSYQRVTIINDSTRFVSKVFSPATPGLFIADVFGGLQVSYDFADVKDSVLPQKGITFSLNAKHTQNFNYSDQSFQLYSGNVQFFIPLIPKFSLAIKTGGAIISGTPEFYQYPSIGESYNLRGFRRERFTGKSTLYNNSELRFITKVRSYLFNGKAGLMAFVDNGRVWMPGESSEKIHTTYGGGILLAPFNMTSVAITYGISDELKMLQFRVGFLF